jgi:hypothetical protein
MNLTFEYFNEEVDDDLSFDIEKNNKKRRRNSLDQPDPSALPRNISLCKIDLYYSPPERCGAR